MTQRDDTDSQVTADHELLNELETLAALMNEQNPDLGAIVIGAALRLRELTAGGLVLGLDRREAESLYAATFTQTSYLGPPPDPPTPAMRTQAKLAKMLGKDNG